MDFQLHLVGTGMVPLTPVSFKGQLCVCSMCIGTHTVTYPIVNIFILLRNSPFDAQVECSVKVEHKSTHRCFNPQTKFTFRILMS